MKKFLTALGLAAFLLLPTGSWAGPLDIPYQVLVTTSTNTGAIILSTTNFSGGGSGVNSNAASYQWCIDHLVVSSTSSISTVTMAWSTTTLMNYTTDYQVVVSSGQPYDAMWAYHNPYCAPIGQTILTIKSSVTSAFMTVEAFLFKGWTP